MYHRPVAYEANAQIVYPDKDHSYKLLVTYSESDGMAGQAQGDRTDLLADGLDSALPCQLYVLNEETGEVAWEEFAEKVKSCEVETVPQENAKKLEYRLTTRTFRMQPMFRIFILWLIPEAMISSGS